MKSESIKRQNARKRLHDLIFRHGIGTATDAELAKLKRYQALFRLKPGKAERRATEMANWRIRKLTKELGRLTHTL